MKQIYDLCAFRLCFRKKAALVTLATELKHTNEHLRQNEKKLNALESAPRVRAQNITTAVITSLVTGLITALIGILLA